MNCKVLLFSCLIVVSILLGMTSPVGAQGIDWSNPFLVLLNDNPEIVSEVFAAFGVSPNYNFHYYMEVFATETEGGGWTGQLCNFENYQGGSSTFRVPRQQVMSFNVAIGTPGSPSDEVAHYVSMGYVVESSQNASIEGLSVVYVLYSHANMPDEVKAQEAMIELVPGSGEYFTWFIEEWCVRTFGDTMPDVHDVLGAFVQTIKNYGFLTPEEEGIFIEPPPESELPVEVQPLEPVDEILPEQVGAEATAEMDSSQVPIMLGFLGLGAVSGVALGQGLSLLAARRAPRRATVPAAPRRAIPEGMAYSPVTNTLVPEEQAYQEKLRLRDGWSYNANTEGWDAPREAYMPEVQSMVTREANELVARRKAEKDLWQREYDRREERLAQLNAHVDKRSKANYEAYKLRTEAARLNAAVDVGEFVLDVTVSVIITRRVPKKLTAFLVSEGYALSMMVYRHYRDDTNLKNDVAKHILTLPVNLLPEFAGKGAPLVNSVAEESGKNLLQKVIEKGYDWVTGN